MAIENPRTTVIDVMTGERTDVSLGGTGQIFNRPHTGGDAVSSSAIVKKEAGRILYKVIDHTGQTNVVVLGDLQPVFKPKT